MKPHVKSIIQLIEQHCPDPADGAEVGVWKGETSAELGKAFPRCHLHLVDCWKEWKPGDVYYDKHKVMGRLTQDEWDNVFREAHHNVESTGVAFTVVNATTLKGAEFVDDSSLDFVFLDANHMYEEVKADILAWRPKVRPGGLILGHDYKGVWDSRGIWGISKAVHEIFGESRVISKPGLIWAVVQR